VRQAGTRTFVVATVAAVLVGITGVQSAYAATDLTVTPSSNLDDGQEIAVELSGFTVAPLQSVQIAQCGNAYADNTPLPVMPSTVPNEIDAVNCEVIGFRAEGTITASPVTISGPSVTARQMHIGSGNRSCVDSPPALAPCFVYVSSSVNMPTFPTVDIAFAEEPPPEMSVAAPTTTTVTAVGSPLAEGKTAYAYVRVTTADPSLRPEGLVRVYEGPTELGSALLAPDATAHVALGSPPRGDHTIDATFTGNGSFASSSSVTTPLSIISADNISIGDVSVVEGNTTSRTVVFPIVLSKPSIAGVSVTYTVFSGGADPASVGFGAGFDVQQPSRLSTSRTVVFKPLLATVRYIAVKLTPDTVPEPDETFWIVLSNVSPTSGYEIRKGLGVGTIYDDDGAPTAGPVLEVGDASVAEGDVGGPRALKFPLYLSEPVSANVIVNYHVESVSAVRGNKYTGDWGGGVARRLLIRAGRVGGTVGIPAFADVNHELDETIRVVVDSAPGVAIGPRSTSIGTIYSDE